MTIPDYPTDEDILRGALKALKNGADSIFTAPTHSLRGRL